MAPRMITPAPSFRTKCVIPDKARHSGVSRNPRALDPGFRRDDDSLSIASEGRLVISAYAGIQGFLDPGFRRDDDSRSIANEERLVIPAYAGIQGFLDPGFRRDDAVAPGVIQKRGVN